MCPKSNQSPNLVTLLPPPTYLSHISAFEWYARSYLRRRRRRRVNGEKATGRIRVTRIGEFLPLWQNFKVFGQFSNAIFSFWRNFAILAIF